MARVAAFSRAFAGRWLIVELDAWDNGQLDVGEEAHITFGAKADGEIACAGIRGILDVRYGSRDGSAIAEFSWEGDNEGGPACGRGWAVLGRPGFLVGHLYIHKAGDSGFVCERG